MQARNEILEELRLLSTTVSTISRENPYQVPAGYFNGFPAQMLSLTARTAEGSSLPDTTLPSHDLAEGTSLPAGRTALPNDEVPFFSKTTDKPLTFSVPEGYFEGFAENLLNRIRSGQAGQPMQPDLASITQSGQPNQAGVVSPGQPDLASITQSTAGSARQELAQLSPLLNSISRNNPYDVPETYFEELSPIMAPLASLRDKPRYTVPEGYFTALADEIISRLHLSTRKESPELQAGLESPELGTRLESPEIRTRLGSSEKEPARVISINRETRRIPRIRQWQKVSAAAAAVVLIATFGWLRLHNPSGHPNTTVEIAKNLGKVSDQDLQTYLENNIDQTTTESMNSTATLDINDSDVKSLLGDVPDGDLKQYMEEHGGAVDIATN